jgi:hypothetical protein
VLNKEVWLWSLLILLAVAGTAPAQTYLPDPDVLAKIRACTQDVTLVGRIGYAKQRGGYFLHGRFGVKEILNQNHRILNDLARRGKTVVVRGRVNPLELFANHLYIVSLDGKPYHGAQAPLVPVR